MIEKSSGDGLSSVMIVTAAGICNAANQSSAGLLGALGSAISASSRASHWQQVNDRRAVAQSQPERYTPGELRAKSMHGRLLKKFFPLAGPGQPARGRGRRGQQQPAGA